MTRFFGLLLVLLGLVAARPARAQYYRRCPCCCHDTTTLPKRSNHSTLLAGAGLTTDRSGHAYGGISMEAGRAIRPRLTVGLRWWLGFARASSSYGYGATQPVLSYYSLAGSARYQLLNTRRWRVEALAGVGAGGVDLEDRDQLVGTGRALHTATVFFSVHPLVAGGAGLTYKAGRDTWLSAGLGYQYLPGTGGLGAPGEFSGWLATLSAAIPWGWL